MYNQNEAKELIENIMEYYQVHTLSDLSKKMGIGQPAISKWKSNNSINIIKKKCRELGVYNEIFKNTEIYVDLDKTKPESEKEAYQSLFETAYNFAKLNNRENELKKLLKDFI